MNHSNQQEHVQTTAHEMRERILQNLDRPLVLTGLMGAGKTRLGRQLGKRLDLRFYDSDEEIEKAAAMKVTDIFEKFGEAYFRDGERRVLKRLLNKKTCVIATGGGAVLNDETRAMIKEKAYALWIKPDLDTLVERTSRRNTRPLLQNGDPRAILQRLLKERTPVYAQSDMVLDDCKMTGESNISAALRVIDEFFRQKNS